MIAQPVQTIRGPKDGTETSSDHVEERSQDHQPASGCPVPLRCEPPPRHPSITEGSVVRHSKTRPR